MRDSNRLSALTVSKLREPGRYGDGHGLWLQVAPGGAKSWLFRFMLKGQARQMGLGPVHTVSLAEARQAALAARKLLLAGVDPIEARRAEHAQARLEAASAVTFKEAAEAYIASHRAGWRNEKHAEQWSATLTTYAYPVIGDLSVAGVDVGLVLKVLEPIWKEKPETAGRVRGRVEMVLDWAAARGYRRGDNPARWRGHLDKLLPARSKVRRVEHHPALPYVELPAFVALVRLQDGMAARALEFAILTAARTSEVVGARWGEVDLEAKVWTVPGIRMKAGKDHRAPLAPRALEILAALPREGEFVFPGAKARAPLSNMSMLALLKRMGRGDLTVHGFRSTFRDWAAERTAYPREVAEMALAHAVSDKVEAAYRRGDLFAKRVRLMADWAKFCAAPAGGGKVVGIRQA